MPNRPVRHDVLVRWDRLRPYRKPHKVLRASPFICRTDRSPENGQCHRSNPSEYDCNSYRGTSRNSSSRRHNEYVNDLK